MANIGQWTPLTSLRGKFWIGADLLFGLFGVSNQ